MKKLVLVLVLAAAGFACNFANQIVAGAPTETPFVLPDLSGVTYEPTATPVVVTPTATPTPVPSKSLPEFFYTIKPGEMLGKIAEKFGMNTEYLAAINGIPDPNWIYAGQTLVLAPTEEVVRNLPNGRIMVLKLSEQKVYAYENGQAVREFLVSTGIPAYPTRVGHYQIREKLETTRMTGPGYDLPNVRWTMYFDEGRGFHAKYWNEIYGRPSSHGCVNMTKDDAKWLYDWAYIGDVVLVIP